MEADEETAALALQLQLEDLASILTPADDERNNNDDAASDQTYALQLYQRELSTQKTILDDRRIAREVQAGRRILTTTAEGTQATPRDQSSARHIADRGNADGSSGAATEGPDSAPTANPTSAGDDEATVTSADDNHSKDLKELLSKPTTSNVSEAEDTKSFTAASPRPTNDTVLNARANDGDIETGESSAQGAIKGKGKRPAPVDDDDEDNERPSHLICDICRSKCPFFDVTTLSACRHRYCRDCLDQLFSLSLTDEMLFPPRCCRQAISFDDVRVYLSADTARDFERKRPELETADRTYCHLPTCSTWLSPTQIEDGKRVGTCPSCAARTCTVCKAEAHDWGEEECMGDEATQELLRAMEENKWQRCYRCKRIVELRIGCFHITCPCGGEFCYLCGEIWKKCQCRWWDEHRLMDQAEQVAQRRLGRNAVRIDVNRAAQRLRENPDCTHVRHWVYVPGRHECEVCHDELWKYIWECRQCLLHSCTRCRLNRLR